MKREQRWVVPRTSKIPDPRLAIAKHINWTRPQAGYDTEYSLPEPDNYNYAGFAERPIECPILQCQVFYQHRKKKGWWSVYYVPDELLEDFLTWSQPIQFEICWTPFKLPKMRQRRPLLKSRKGAVEQTIDERLYTMGYFDELQSQHNIDISHILGTPRPDLFDNEFT
jgi:hypothetical protein